MSLKRITEGVEIVEHGGQWFLIAGFSLVPMVDEWSARRTLELMTVAEVHGQNQAINYLRSAMGLPEAGG